MPRAIFTHCGSRTVKGDERTLIRFTLDDAGNVTDLNTRPLTIVQRTGL